MNTSRGIPWSEIEKWPTKPPTFRPSPHDLPFLSACPNCTHATRGLVHFIRRPGLICGQRSGVWMLVPAPGCTHCDHRNPVFCNVEAAPLVERWNKWAKEQAALVVKRRGMNPDATAYFLAALVDPKL